MRPLIMLLSLFLPFALTPGAAAQQRETFRDWTVSCNAILCGAQTTGERGAALRIEPLGPARRTLYLTLAEGAIKPGSWVAMAIDGVPTARFGPIDGWRIVSSPSERSYEFAPSIVNIDLLRRLKRGRVVTVVYVDEDDNAGVLDFSLLGVTAALAWLDDA